MLLNKILQGDYTVSSLYHQIKLPLDIEISIPSDDPVRLVSAFVEEMNLSDLYETYDRIRKNQATPRQIFPDSVIGGIEFRKIHSLHKCTQKADRVISWDHGFHFEWKFDLIIASICCIIRL